MPHWSTSARLNFFLRNSSAIFLFRALFETMRGKKTHFEISSQKQKSFLQKKRKREVAPTSEHSSALMKSHSSLSILETWPLPFSSAQGTLLLPLTTLQSERIVSLFLALKLQSFQGVFSLLSLSPSLPFPGLI